MSVFQYYLPGIAHDKVDDALLRDVLGARLRDCLGRHWRSKCTCAYLTKGPDGGEGAIVWGNPVGDSPVPLPRQGYRSQKSDDGRFWILWQDRLPGPEELQRSAMVAGVGVELLDERVWQCPTIRSMAVSPRVPCVYSRHNGQVKRSPSPSYQAIWEKSGAWLAQYFTGSVPHEMLIDCATESLSLNYRIGDEEVAMLGLFDEASMLKVMDAALDMAALEDQKKRDALSSLLAAAMSHGSEDSLPTTDLLAGS